ncbi:MAG: aldolase/citrate lyase family protein [Chloroflexi bacterium]|nr:aldolase/citrate lyase family protein [Chloroflexota bacterium]
MPESNARKVITHHVNPVTRALREGRVCIGALSISFPCAPVAQIYAQAGFSWYYMDMEHGQLSYDQVREISYASKLAGIVPVAGPTSLSDHLIARPLDAGAMGVVAPHVETADQTELVVNFSRYPPMGKRGLIAQGPPSNFEAANSAEWVEEQNREMLVAVKVESGTGIDNVDEIASVPGLDAIIIGPGDLSATLGIPGQTDHPDVIDCIERMLAATKRHGIAGGPHVSTPEKAAHWVEKGATFMSLNFDGAMLLDTSQRVIEEVRGYLGSRML